MSNLESHPSYLRLDRHCLGAETSEETEQHLTGCARCRDYVARYRPAADLPAWLVAGTRTAMARPERRTHGAWWALAAAAVLCLAWLGSRTSPDYDGVKGAPAALLHVQHAGATRIWSGEALAVGDRIRLEVMPDQFDHVSVFSLPADGGVPSALYAGQLQRHKPALLPKAWQLDAAPGPERLAVIFAHALISAESAQQLLHARDPHEVSVLRLDVPKQPASK